MERYLNKIFNFVGKISEELIDNEFYTTFECRLKRNNCEKYVWIKINVITQYNQAGIPVKVIGSFIDIDTQKRHQALLELQAKRDSLTGLYNKGTTETLIQEFVNQSENLQNSHALFLIDIDGFKEVNDYFGHLFGDTVINDIAMSIKKHFRTTDILGRVGGDEFVVFMKDVESDAILMNKCKLLLKELRRNYSSDKQIFMISASIGIALFPLHGNSFKKLFKQADSAMYRAKETGKDKYIIYEKNMKQPKYQNNRNVNIQEYLYNDKKPFKENIQEYVFNLLYRSKDTKMTIKMLLEVLGRAFEVDRVFIYEYDNILLQYMPTFEWNGKGIKSSYGFYKNEEVQEIVLSLYQETKFGFVSRCDDVSRLGIKNLDRFTDTTKAFLHSKILEQGEEKGCIGFDDCHQARKWSEKEIETLNSIANILGTFLLKQNAFDMIQKKQEKIYEIINHIDAWIYVIDKNNFDVLFINQPMEKFIKLKQKHLKCYKTLYNRDEICPNCPIPDLCKNKNIIFNNELSNYYGINFKTKAVEIEWSEGKEAYLVISYGIV